MADTDTTPSVSSGHTASSKAVVGIQLRTNSSRLPGKAFLSLAAMPMAVLVARRAMTSGYPVRVLTSTEASDDNLATLLQRFQIPCYRGSLDNVLERFCNAFSDCAEQTIVVRLTGDNPFPDGALIRQAVAAFTAQEADYLLLHPQNSGLPYGMSVEVTRLSWLRRAHTETDSAEDREHVMPWVRRHGSVVYPDFRHCFHHHLQGQPDHPALKALPALRCTIDTLEDFLQVEALFTRLECPLSVSYQELCLQLWQQSSLHTGAEDATEQSVLPKGSRSYPQLVLGTAQLGMHYGIANHQGKLNLPQVASLLDGAHHLGIQALDTANAYGDSEALIGRYLRKSRPLAIPFQVATKLDPLTDLDETAAPTLWRQRAEQSVFQSLARLGCQCIDQLLLHRVAHLDAAHGAVWDVLLQLQEHGLIRQLGVSVNTPDELSRALQEPHVAVIQMPFNVLDDRWLSSMAALQATDKRIDCRSVFLQGLLLQTETRFWDKTGVGDTTAIRQWLVDALQITGASSLQMLCLGFVKTQPWVQGLVLGCETLEQLEDIVTCYQQVNFSAQAIADVLAARPDIPPALVSPWLWPA